MRHIGRYQLQEKLGQGGMGVVYRAFDTLLERVVAVKLISASIDENPELRDRFFREARAAGQLSHPNVITVHDLGEHEGQPYLAMEFLEGEDLQSRMARREPMSLRRKLDVAIEICAGLEYAHAHGIVHRDIKPANIFLNAGGVVKILDFGLARLVTSELTRSHMMMGTLNYMAPEQIRGDRADHRADIFSAGVVFYELLSGRKAFDGDSFASMMFKILQEEPTPLREIDPTLPGELVNVVDRAMAKLRDERYQQIGDVSRDLVAIRQELAFLDSPASGRVSPSVMRTPGSRPGATSASQDETRLITSPVPGAIEGGPLPGSENATPLAEEPPVPPAASRRGLWLGVGALALVLVLVAIVAAWMHGRSTAPPPVVAEAPAAPGPAASELIRRARASLAAEDFAAAERDAGAVLARDPANTEAVDVRNRARAARATVTDGLARARQAFEQERFDDASTAAAAVLTAAPRNAEAQQLMKASAERSRGSAAQDARAQAGRARTAARAARAQTLAPQPYAAAAAAERQAAQLLSDGRDADATARFFEASGLFRGAQVAAENEAAAREARARVQAVAPATAAPAPSPEPEPAPAPATETPTVPAPQAPEPPAPTPPPAPVRPEPPASTSAPTTTPPAPAPNPSAAPSPAPAPRESAPPAPTVAINALLQDYREALESRSLPALRRIWPGLGGAQLTAIRNEFEHANRITVELVDPRTTVNGATATVSLVRRYALVTIDGQRLETESRTTMTLRRAGDGWVIESIRFQ